MYRQGDLLIVKDPQIPALRWRVDSGIVELGEATGHAHRLVGGEVWNGGTVLIVPDTPAELTHDEHDTIILPEGHYRVLRQREHLGQDE